MPSYQNGDAVEHSTLPPRIVLSQEERYLNIVAATILGASAGIPYASPAYKAAGSWNALGYMFAGSTAIAFGGASTWGWHTLLEEITQKYHTREIHVTSNAIKHVAGACGLATCSGLLNMYIVKKYNNSLLLPVVTFVNWYGWDASGFYKLISYLTAVRSHNELDNLSPSECEKFLKKMIMVFPVGNLIVNSYLSFQAGEEVVGHNLCALPFIVLALSQFSLEVFGAYELVAQGFEYDASDDAVLTRNEALAKLLFKILTLTIMLFATSSDVFIAVDNFGHNAAGITLASLAIGSSLILGQYVLSDLANQGMMLFSSKPTPSHRSSMVIEEEKDVEQKEQAVALLSNEEDETLSSDNESTCRLC